MPDSIFDQLDQVRQVTSAAQAAGVRPELAHALIGQESGGDQGAISPKGAVGLMQVMPATAAQPGFGVQPFDPHDPQQNLTGGLSYLKALLNHFGGDERKALAAYNGGVGNVDNGKASAFPETTHYVDTVSKNAGQPDGGDIFSQLDAVRAAKAAPTPAVVAPEEGKSLAGFASKIGPSVSNLATGVANAVIHPLDTAANVIHSAAGAVQSVLPARTTKVDATGGLVLPEDKNFTTAPANPDFTAYSDAMAKFYKNRYGSLKAVGNTLYNDPAGAAADVAGALTGVGGAAEGLATKGSVLGRIASGVSKAGELVDPIQGATKAISTLVQGPAEQLAQHVTNVNMQIPKALRRKELNAPFTPAEAVLNEGRGTNPFTRLSKGGLENAQANGEKFTGQFNALLDKDAAAGNTYPISSIDQILADQQSGLMHDINGQPKVAQVQSIRDNLSKNPLYSKDKMGTVMVPQTTPGTPASTILGSNGQPLRAATPASTTMVPQQQVIGRELIPQTAKELNVIKGNVDKGLTFGERGGTLEEAQKAARHGIDSIIDQNVPGADVLNQRRAQNAVATKALQDAILSRETKRGAGMAESLLFASPIIATEGHPLLGAAAAVPWAYNTMVKHPTLSSPLAAGAHAVGTYSMPAAAKTAAQVALPASRINTATGMGRPLTKEELDQQLQAYLARHPQP